MCKPLARNKHADEAFGCLIWIKVYKAIGMTVWSPRLFVCNYHHFAGVSLISIVSVPPASMSLCSMYGRLWGLPLSFMLLM